MAERVIPLMDHRQKVRRATVPVDSPSPSGRLIDTRGRALRDLRISVTDRCNFRCSYCMPKAVFDADHAYLPQPALRTGAVPLPASLTPRASRTTSPADSSSASAR